MKSLFRNRRSIGAGARAAIAVSAILAIAPPGAVAQQGQVVRGNDFEALDSIMIPLPGQSAETGPTGGPVNDLRPEIPSMPSQSEGSTAATDGPIGVPDLRIENPPGTDGPVQQTLAPPAFGTGSSPVAGGAAFPGIESPLLPVGGMDTARSDARIVGEAPAARFHLFAESVPRAPRLQIHYQTAVDILPTASELSVFVNGVFVGAFRPDASLRPRNVALDVPRETLTVGRNIVEIRGRQRHRVACSAEAGFDLWASIDPGQSGLMATGGQQESGPAGGSDFDTPVGPASLAIATARTIADGRPIAVSFQDGASIDAVRAAIAAAEEIGVLMGGRVPDYVVRADPFASPGEAADHVRIRLFPAERNAVRIARGGDGAVVLAVDYTDGNAAEAIRSAFPMTAVPEALTPMTGRAVSFAAFDGPDIQVSERYRREDIAFRLPEDWLVENDRQAEISLDYAFVRGLPEGSQLVLSVNDSTIRLLPLDRGGGQPIDGFPIRFPARLLSPGPNAVTVEIRIPGRSETSACPDILAAESPPMAAVFRTSTLTIPDGSPFRSTPNLAPLTSPPGAPDRTVITVDATPGAPDRLERLLTVAGALSSSLGEAAGIRVGETGEWGESTTAGVALRVVRPVDLTEADLAGFGLTLADVLPRLATGGGRLPSVFDAADAAQGDVPPMEALRRSGLIPRADTATPARFTDPRDNGDSARQYWDRADSETTDDGRDAGLLNRLMIQVSGLPNRLWRFAGSLGWVTSSDPAMLMASLDEPASSMILDRASDSGRTILVVADGPEQLRRTANAMATGISGGGPRGAFALVSADGRWINYSGGARTVEQTGAISIAGVFPAAGTLASAYPVGFIILVLAALALAAVATSRIFARLGDRGDH
ncbi:cellulose biosynthesis cyclic di-GMP-binding regulatory protein BcsB [Fodinicurvata sp. EGI_FJ10296]|uniref:cellulose biosynthesis cyclic di-GMP-binding regulatory protein BcsB n=1 Tax=Fodinicurvata sp. EGI_FJ10296 TaxID=3231908 RepID=UPI003451EE8D